MGRASVRSKAPLQSVKNIVDGTFISVAGGVTTDLVVAQAVNDYTGTSNNVPIGCHIKAVWVEYSYQDSDSDTIGGRTDMYMAKLPGMTTVAQFPVPGSTSAHAARRFIFLERKGLFNLSSNAFGTGSVARGFAGWVRIPKRYQRMGEFDQILIRIGSSNDYSACVKTIYKWKI